MTKRSSFKFLFLSFLLIFIAGTASLNLTEENSDRPSSLSDDVFTEQQAEHTEALSLFSLSSNCLRISHFSTSRNSHRSVNRTLTGSNGINSINNYLTSVYSSSEKELCLSSRKYSGKTYFLYTLQRINI